MPRGGYAQPYPVTAVVRKIGAKRMQIEVRTKSRYRRSLPRESELK